MRRAGWCIAAAALGCCWSVAAQFATVTGTILGWTNCTGPGTNVSFTPDSPYILVGTNLYVTSRQEAPIGTDGSFGLQLAPGGYKVRMPGVPGYVPIVVPDTTNTYVFSELVTNAPTFNWTNYVYPVPIAAWAAYDAGSSTLDLTEATNLAAGQTVVLDLLVVTNRGIYGAIWGAIYLDATSRAVAIGLDPIWTNGQSSLIVGDGAGVSGSHSAAVGLRAEVVDGASCVALGEDASASGFSSIAIGNYASATANGSVAIGALGAAAGANTIVINALGSGLEETNIQRVVLAGAGIRLVGEVFGAGPLAMTNGYYFPSNALSAWPAAPRSEGEAFIGNSNGVVYLLTSGTGLSWTSTNKLGP